MVAVLVVVVVGVSLVRPHRMVAVLGLTFLVLILSQVPVMELAVHGSMVVTPLEIMGKPNKDLVLSSSLIPLEQRLTRTSISLAIVHQ